MSNKQDAKELERQADAILAAAEAEETRKHHQTDFRA